MTGLELDSRINTLVSIFQEDELLSEGLSDDVNVLKGPFQVTGGPTGNFVVYVSRAGLSNLEYGIKNDPVRVTAKVAIGVQTTIPSDREEMEAIVNRFAMNVIRTLINNSQVVGDEGWYSGVVTGSDSVRLRGSNGICELEVIEFEITFEVGGI